MQEFRDRVAVITGGASGIGLGIARRCAREGMRVVLADIEPAALAQAEAELRAMGAQTRTVVADVSKAAEVEALARQALEAFGAVHLLCNNAGVGAGAAIWEGPLSDWEWVMGVNLWGVIYGVRVFVPIMLGQDTPCHIVNTASIAGLIDGPGLGIYKVTKHAVVTLSETLYHELALRGSKVHVSVLCPEWVNTRIMDSARNRPAELQDAPAAPDPMAQAIEQMMRQAVEQGMSPDQVAERVFAAIRDEQLYIITHPETKKMIQRRMENMLSERNPNLL
jgi:NAD(P)-dependent dehydrogenase (short-subunit alcohol dehydrogenase family)